MINNKQYILVNFYNENIEKYQVELLNELDIQLANFETSDNTKIIVAGDFNFNFDKNLETKGGNLKLNKLSIAEFMKLMAKYDLTDIWRIPWNLKC